MPSRGKPVEPTASIRRIVSKRREETSRSGSSWMPANSGCQKALMNAVENPAGEATRGARVGPVQEIAHGVSPHVQQ